MADPSATRRTAPSAASAGLSRALEAWVPAAADAILALPNHADLRARLGHDPRAAADLYDRLLRLGFAHVIRRIAAVRGLVVPDVAQILLDEPWAAADAPLPAPELLTAASDAGSLPVHALGAAYEQLLELTPVWAAHALTLCRAAGHRRKTTGTYFTPAPLVEHLLDEALEPALAAAADAQAVLSMAICDPACGAGNFLLAAGRRIASRLRQLDPKADPGAALTCLYGMDASPLAAALCRACLWLELATPGQPAPPPNIATGDALLADWPACFPAVFARGGFEAVVGNPPFLNQLGAATATPRAAAAALKKRFPGAVGPYTDPAALFMVLASRVTRPGGRVALVQPQSVLAARDAAPARRDILGRGHLESLWVAGERVFDAGVLACALVIRVGNTPPTEIRRTAGAAFRPLPPAAPGPEPLAASWAPLAAAALGIPEIPLRSSGTLADLATATADFRDQFYGLRGCIVDDADVPETDRARCPALVTTGLIDPAACLWGRVPTRVDGRLWNAPRVDVRRLGDLAPWARSRLVPKILLATQTRILEAAIDEAGAWLPAVPLISIMPRDPADLRLVAAALISPSLSAWAAAHYGASGLSAGVIKLSARQTVGLPMPEDRGSWAAAADLLWEIPPDDAARHELLLRLGGFMARAYGQGEAQTAELLRWWARGVRRAGANPTRIRTAQA